MIRRLTPDDKNLFTSICLHDSVFPYITDDGIFSNPLYDIGSVLMIDKIYCLVYGPGILFILIPYNFVTYEVHTCVLPQYRGKEATRATKVGAKWMFTETPCQKINTFIPITNTQAYALARSAGMKIEGVNKKSFLKDGVLYDQIMMGLCKEDVCLH